MKRSKKASMKNGEYVLHPFLFGTELEMLIEKAERVEELEKEFSKCADSHTYLEMQNKRYREALEEIAQKRMTYADMAGALRIANKALEDENMENIDKRIIDKGFHTGYEVDFVTIQKSDYEYLKEQAERVQELEDKLARIRFVNSDYDKINKRYQEHFNWIIQNSTDKYAVQASYEALEAKNEQNVRE